MPTIAELALPATALVESTCAALSALEIAYDAGSRIVASRLNQVLKLHGVACQIKHRQLLTDRSLTDCREQMNRALRILKPFVPEIPWNDLTRPWCVGRVYDSMDGTDPIAHVGSLNSAENEIEETVRLLTDHRGHWKAKTWRQKIVVAVQQDRDRWKRAFEEIARLLESTFGHDFLEVRLARNNIGSAANQYRILSTTQLDILTALDQLEAYSASVRRTSNEIAHRVIGPAWNPGTLKKQLRSLVVAKLIASQQGSQGGYWITASGRRQLPRQIRHA